LHKSSTVRSMTICTRRVFSFIFRLSQSRDTRGKSLDVTKFAWSAPPFCLRASLFLLLLLLATIRKREPVMQIMKRRRRHRRVPFSRAAPTGRPDGAHNAMRRRRFEIFGSAVEAEAACTHLKYSAGAQINPARRIVSPATTRVHKFFISRDCERESRSLSPCVVSLAANTSNNSYNSDRPACPFGAERVKGSLSFFSAALRSILQYYVSRCQRIYKQRH
jgi:hypothetical protein